MACFQNTGSPVWKAGRLEHLNLCMYIDIRVYVCMHVCVLKYVCMPVCMSVCMYACMKVCACMYGWMDVNMCVYSTRYISYVYVSYMFTCMHASKHA